MEHNSRPERSSKKASRKKHKKKSRRDNQPCSESDNATISPLGSTVSRRRSKRKSGRKSTQRSSSIISGDQGAAVPPACCSLEKGTADELQDTHSCLAWVLAAVVKATEVVPELKELFPSFNAEQRLDRILLAGQVDSINLKEDSRNTNLPYALSDEWSCAICLEHDVNWVLELPCNHRFHKLCLQRHFSGGFSACPVCRVPCPLEWCRSNGLERTESLPPVPTHLQLEAPTGGYLEFEESDRPCIVRIILGERVINLEVESLQEAEFVRERIKEFNERIEELNAQAQGLEGKASDLQFQNLKFVHEADDRRTQILEDQELYQQLAAQKASKKLLAEMLSNIKKKQQEHNALVAHKQMKLREDQLALQCQAIELSERIEALTLEREEFLHIKLAEIEERRRKRQIEDEERAVQLLLERSRLEEQERKAREERRKQVEEQDVAYAMSLAADRERVEAERVQELADGAIVEEAKSLLNEEPIEAPGHTLIILRLPDGSRAQRRFANTDTIAKVRAFATVSLASRNLLPIHNFALVIPYPRRTLDVCTATIHDSGIASSSGNTIYVERC